MRFFLASQDFGSHKNWLVGKAKNAAVITVAAEYSEKNQYQAELNKFINSEVKNLASIGIRSSWLDVQNIDPTDTDALQGFDMVWVTGGNTFYLNYWLHTSGLFNIISQKIINENLLYGGYSAGAVIASNDIDYIAPMDAIDIAPAHYATGLGLTQKLLVPHYGNSLFARGINTVIEQNSGANLLVLHDHQVLVSDGELEEVLL